MPVHETTALPPRRAPMVTPARVAVSLLFLANGFLVGSWAPKIPEFAARLELSKSALGMMIFCFGIGSLVAMPLVGAAIARRGSRSVLKLLALMSGASMLMVTFAPGILTAAAGLFAFGALIGGMDVAMNANAVEVERRQGRAIMSSCHGFWSLGGVLGSGLGGLVIAGAGVAVHALAALAAVLVMVAIAWPRVMADPPAPHVPVDGSAAPSMVRAIFGSGATVWLIGLMCLLSMLPEGAVLDWGALYLRQELGASAALSGFGFGAFSATMALVRFVGDIVRDRFGAVATMRGSVLLAMAGMAISGMAGSAEMVIAGYGIAGLGLANMVPIAFSAAGNLPGLPPGVGISLVTFMGYSGILFFPSIIGFIAEHTGFAAIFTAIPVLLLLVLALSGLVSHADSNRPDGEA
ncbi:fucose permease [Hoeflea marina]|uniref:Fucose permease n=1 Tax=Hoeflea marina TaxID=274592 RepID=A0A317PF00_9HYPH|nr:MFS transporter [Hoeflea marina]PWV98210.1 fucose permease [Hoeflea marina]